MGDNRKNGEPVLVVSACLVGEQVRYDGSHKRNPFITEKLASVVRIIRLCPEVEAGFGTPREPIELIESQGDVRIQTVQSKRDVTERLAQLAKQRISELQSTDVDGFIFKRGSPSCGIENVKVRQHNGEVARTGEGIFAAAVKTAFPSWAIASEDQLSDELTRFCFVTQLFASSRLRSYFSRRVSAEEVVKFHQRERLLVLAFSERHFVRLNDLVANVKKYLADDFAKAYQRHYRTALSQRPTVESMKNSCRTIANLAMEQSYSNSKSLHTEIENASEVLHVLNAVSNFLKAAAITQQLPCITEQHSLFSPFPHSLATNRECSLGSVTSESQKST